MRVRGRLSTTPRVSAAPDIPVHSASVHRSPADPSVGRRGRCTRGLWGSGEAGGRSRNSGQGRGSRPGRLPGEAWEDEELNAWRKCFRQRAQLEQASGGGRAGDAGSTENPGWERPAGALVRGRGSACRGLRPHPRGCGRGRPQTPRGAAGVPWSLRALRLGPPRSLKAAAPSLQRSR